MIFARLPFLTRAWFRRAGAAVEIPLVFAVFLALGAFSAVKCLSGAIYIGYLPYWYLSLTRGFTRRSLPGTLTSPLLAGKPLDEAVIIVASVCSAGVLVLLLAMTLGVCAVYRRQAAWRGKLLWVLVALVGFSSPILQIHAIGVSTLDQFLFLGVLGITVALLRRWFACALAVAVLLPLVHEGFPFLAVPPLLWIGIFHPDRRRIAAVCGVTMIAMTILLMTRALPVGNFPASVPLPAATIAVFEGSQLSQTASGGVAERMEAFSLEWRRHGLAVAWSSLPILAMLGATLLALPRGARRAALLRIGIGAGMAMSILLAAYDLWRFFAWGDAIAFLLCGLELAANPARLRQPARTRPAAPLAIAVPILIQVFISLDAPSFIWGSSVVALADRRPAPLVPALARISEDFTDFYNRLPPAQDPARLDLFTGYYNRPPPAGASGRERLINYRRARP